MHALITGGAGFIGSHLVDRLVTEGHRVTVVDDLSTGRRSNLAEARATAGDRLTVHELDVTSPELVRLSVSDPPDVAFHLAAQISVVASIADPVADVTSNVVGTVNLLEACHRAGVKKVINTTSGGCLYGEPPRADLPIAEDYDGMPESPYGISKLSAEHYLGVFESLHGLRWTSLALANVFGPRQDPGGEAGVVSIFGNAMLGDDDVVIFGDGKQTRDFVHVSDVVEAYLAAVEGADSLRLNVGTGAETSVDELFARVAALTDYRRNPRYDEPREGELKHIALDCARAAEQLGWTPRMGLEDGLRSVVGWLRG